MRVTNFSHQAVELPKEHVTLTPKSFHASSLSQMRECAAKSTPTVCSWITSVFKYFLRSVQNFFRGLWACVMQDFSGSIESFINQFKEKVESFTKQPFPLAFDNNNLEKVVFFFQGAIGKK